MDDSHKTPLVDGGLSHWLRIAIADTRCDHAERDGNACADCRLQRALAVITPALEQLEEIQAKMDKLPEDERIRHEAANAPMLRVQLMYHAGEHRRLRDKLARMTESRAFWRKFAIELESERDDLLDKMKENSGD